MATTQNPAANDSDQGFLDRVFDRAVEALECGASPSLDELLGGREHLRSEIQEIIRLAKGVAVGVGPEARAGSFPTVEGFTVLRELGRGGMGVVYLARQDRLGGRLVALKVLSAVAMHSPRARQRFRAEAHAIAKFRHDHIVAVYDTVQSDECHALVMEWIDGTSMAAVIDAILSQGKGEPTSDGRMHMGVLRSLLGSSPQVPEDRTWLLYVLRTGIAMARALHAVHDAGLLHRDVKPSNILIRRDGTPLLSDFGLAREADCMVTEVGTFVGTVAYASPEQLRGERQLGPVSDVFSLGATLYHALALRMAHQGSSATQMLQMIERSAAPALRTLNPGVPLDLQTVIFKAIDSDPARRYQSAGEFADDLQRVMNLQPIRARPAGALTRTAKLVRRNRASLGAAILGGALAVSLVALALLWAIGFPAWKSAHHTNARMVLLDPEQSDAFIASVLNDTSFGSGVPLRRDAIDRSLAEYAKALRYAPFDAELRRERDLIELVGVVTTRSAPAPVAFPGDADLPLTAAFVSRVHGGWRTYDVERNALRFGPDQLQSASAEDLRALGLVALLSGATSACIEVWSAFDLKANADPLVEAAFGMALLASKQYGRAYPRLRHAVEVYPNVGFLTINLAEAAMKCGDFGKAQDWLHRARDLPGQDRFNGLERVQAGLHAALGNDIEARRLYEKLVDEGNNVVAFDEYAAFLLARGELERALMVQLHSVTTGMVRRDLYTRFVETVERWWPTLDAADRAALTAAYEPLVPFRIDRNGILPTYVWCMEKLGVEAPRDHIPRQR